ncbi:MAG: hypothetical protein Q9180_002736 [Flavoplaca navasiana]
MEATIACSSSTQTLNYHSSPDPVSYAERIKKRLARIATPPSSIIELPAPIEAPEKEANSTNTTTTADAQAADAQALTGQSIGATSVLSSQKVFAVQKFYVSPSKPMDKELQDVWCNEIFDRLNQTLRVAIPTGTCLQEFMHLGKRPTALKPALVINCGDVHVKRQVEKTFKKQIWLQDLLKSRGIMFVALVVKISLSAGPIQSHAKTNNLTEAYAIHLAPFALTSCGSSCFIRVNDGQPHRSCTLGGVIVVNGAAVGLTAGHPFRSFDKHLSSSSNQVTEDPDDDSSSDASSEPFVFNEDDDRAVDTSSTSYLTLDLDVHDSVEYNHESIGLYVSPRWRWQPSSQVVCSHQIENNSTPNAVRKDVPWAYMIAIRPIFDDIRLRLKTDDVRLPTDGEFLKWARAQQEVSELSEDTARPQQELCSHAVDIHGDPATDETPTQLKTHSPMLESANPYEPERNRPLYPLGPEHSQSDNVHDTEHISRPHQVVVEEKESRKSHGNPLMNVPVTVWHRFETFILRTEYQRRGRSKDHSRRSTNRSWGIFETRPVYPCPTPTLAVPRKRTLSNVAIYYLSIGLWYYRWPLSIMYYILFLPFICLVVLRYQTVLIDEEVLQRQFQDGIRMLGDITDHNQLFKRAEQLGVDYYGSGHGVEPPVSEMEMGRFNFEFSSGRRDV